MSLRTAALRRAPLRNATHRNDFCMSPPRAASHCIATISFVHRPAALPRALPRIASCRSALQRNATIFQGMNRDHS